jgi:hypothetical protein
MTFADTQRPMELDIFVSEHNLAFEYQGMQHYTYKEMWRRTPGKESISPVYLIIILEQQQKRDEEKRKACQNFGITLIEIPYWWDQQKASLAATIYSVRPDLIQDTTIIGTPIPKIPPGKPLMRVLGTFITGNQWK